MTDQPIPASGTFTIADGLTVDRLGYGAMQLTGEGVWGPPDDHDGAIAVLREARDLGVTFFDTADSYGPDVSEELVAEALHPYDDDVVIATKAGLVRPGPGDWQPNGRPEHLREACEGSLRRLKLDTIDLYQLHRIDPDVPTEDQIGTFIELRDEGKIRHIGLSEVTVEQFEQVRGMVDVATVQNRYNLTDREWDDVVDACADAGIGFIPWFPIATGDLAEPGGAADEIAQAHDASPAQIALAWLLHRSPTMLPIPGTSSVDHVRDNCAAARIELTDEQYEELTAAVS